jgi:hypothetical protein
VDTVVCISGDIVIARTPEVVFDVLADERNEPSFNPRMVRAEKVTPGPIRPGTRFDTTVRTGGRTADMTVEYTTVDRPWLLASTSAMATARIVGRLTLERVPEGTRLWWSWNVQPTGWRWLLGPVLRVVGRRQERLVWSGLKRHLEQQRDADADGARGRKPAQV